MLERIQDLYITVIDEPPAVDICRWLNYVGDDEAGDGESDDGKYAVPQDDENLHDVQVDDEIIDSEYEMTDEDYLEAPICQSLAIVEMKKTTKGVISSSKPGDKEDSSVSDFEYTGQIWGLGL
ncbi:hypothetical protein TIFTF001_008091 [Ficus carica]|uniref:Uncharacterized protein n=1 Tax=Ficus carica TaxID=3494 RepID=A0AA88D1G9_FICCA|nr:hypothetical protein TIFTF001_008091 [Ficus carica]